MRHPFAAIAAAVLVATGVPSVGVAEPIELTDVRQSLFDTCFATANDGWMVGELGRIFHTTDGGVTWERQDAKTKRPLLTVTCVDAKTAWIAGKEGIVYATADRGATWTLQPTGSNRHVFALEFPNAKRGHGAGDFGQMIHTEDGGATWQATRVPEVKLPDTALDTGVEPGDVNLYGISYAGADHVWIAGEFGIIVQSRDGGTTWHQQSTPIESSLFGIFFADPLHGWAVGIDSIILATDDGGLTWRVLPAPVQQRNFYDVSVRGSIGWIVGESGTVLKSTDAGQSWVVEPLPIQLAARWIRSISLDPSGHGAVVGAEGLVFKLDGSKLTRLGITAGEGRS